MNNNPEKEIAPVGADAIPDYVEGLSGEKQRTWAEKAAFSTKRLQRLGTTILIQEPAPALIAFRKWLNHPANKDIAEVAHTRHSVTAIIVTVAAMVDYTIHSAATDTDAERIMGDLASKLQSRAAIRMYSSND